MIFFMTKVFEPLYSHSWQLCWEIKCVHFKKVSWPHLWFYSHNYQSKSGLGPCYMKLSHIFSHDDIMTWKGFPYYWLLITVVSGVIKNVMASEITGVSIVYSTICFRRRSKKTSKLRVTGLCEGNSPVNGEFPTQRASNMEMFPLDNIMLWEECTSHNWVPLQNGP